MTEKHALAIAVGLLTLVAVVELLRRGQLREKYAGLWLLVAPLVLLLGVFPGLLDWVADLLGVADPPNLLLFAGVMLLLLVSIHLSWEVSRLEEETRTLAEEVALLRLEVEGLGDGSPRPSAVR